MAPHSRFFSREFLVGSRALPWLPYPSPISSSSFFFFFPVEVIVLLWGRVVCFYIIIFYFFLLQLVYTVLSIFYCTAWLPSYTNMYTFVFLTLSCSTITDQTQFPVLHSRISLLIHSKGNSLDLSTSSTPSIPLPPPPLWQLQVYCPSP